MSTFVRSCIPAVLGLISFGAFGQTPSASINPIEVSDAGPEALVTGHAFQLLNPNGVVTNGVEWRVEPAESSSYILENGILKLKVQKTGKYEIRAYFEGQEFVTHYTVLEKDGRGEVVPWKIAPLQGRFSDKVESVKVNDSTPYYYFEDSGPSGALIRAFSYEGVQMWQWPLVPEAMRVELLCADNLGGFLAFEIDGVRKFLVSVDEHGDEKWRRESTGSKDAYSLAWNGTFFLVEPDKKTRQAHIVGIDQSTGEEKFSVAAPESVDVSIDAKSGAECPNSRFPALAEHTGFYSADGDRAEVVFFVHLKKTFRPSCGSQVSKVDNEDRMEFITVSAEDGNSKPLLVDSVHDGTNGRWGTNGMLIPDGHDGILVSFRTRCNSPCQPKASIVRVHPDGTKAFELPLPDFDGATTDGMLLGGTNEKDPNFMGFVSHGPYVIAFQVPSGKEVWRWKSSENVELQYALRDGGVLATSDSATYHVVNGKLQEKLPRDFVLFNMPRD